MRASVPAAFDSWPSVCSTVRRLLAAGYCATVSRPIPYPLIPNPLQPVLLDLPIERPFPDAQHLGRVFAIAAGYSEGLDDEEPLELL